MKKLTTLYVEREQLRAKRDRAVKEANCLSQRIESNARAIAEHATGIDQRTDEIASGILQLSGDWRAAAAEHPDAAKALQEAIIYFARIAEGQEHPDTATDLLFAQIGCKRYERWLCQRCDMPYMRCPRHGSIILSIGLQEHRRDGITREEAGACAIYLMALTTLHNKDNT